MMKESAFKQFLRKTKVIPLYSAFLDWKKKERKKRDLKILRILPINRKKIVFDNVAGGGFGDNPRYIAEEIHRKGMKAKMYWLIKDDKTELPSWIKKLKIGSIRSQYELQTAGFWVDNCRGFQYPPKKRGQIYLQTWHGGLPMKKIEKDAEEKLNRGYVCSAKNDGMRSDGILADGEYIAEIYTRAFWLNPNCEILRTGSPRCDVLLNERDNPAIRKKVCSTLGINHEAYLVLYAPTFRNDRTEGYLTQIDALLETLKRKHGKTVLLIRMHPIAAQKTAELYVCDGAERVNATMYPDVQELILASDCLISDYSTISFDFAIIQKPVFLCGKDVDAYIAERGVYDLFYKQPFPMAASEEDLRTNIEQFDREEYLEKLSAFFREYPTYNRGTAAAQVVDWLIEKGLRKGIT